MPTKDRMNEIQKLIEAEVATLGSYFEEAKVAYAKQMEIPAVSGSMLNKRPIMKQLVAIAKRIKGEREGTIKAKQDPKLKFNGALVQSLRLALGFAHLHAVDFDAACNSAKAAGPVNRTRKAKPAA